jgi:glycosyltransferase involved in cell wall biosynthesis
MKVCLVTRRVPPERCGIGDYTARLAAALARTHDVVIVTGTQPIVEVESGVQVLPVVPDWGPRGMRIVIETLRRLGPDWVCIEYVPFLYHRVGMSFWLPIATLWMRARGLRILLMVHEPFVSMDSPKHLIVGIIQRLMLWCLIAGSEKVAVTTDRWTRMISRLPGSRSKRVFHLPAGSNLPRVESTAVERCRLRAELGFRGRDVVVTMLQPTGAGKLPDVAMRVWKEISAMHADARLLIIGSGDLDGIHVSNPDRVVDAGYVPADRASRLLACGDVFLAPFVDGVSARRTSVMAAMAHGLPVVTTTGHLTDPIFAGSPLVLQSSTDTRGLAGRVDGLIRSPEARRSRGDETRAFFQRHFDWPVLAERLNAELRLAG